MVTFVQLQVVRRDLRKISVGGTEGNPVIADIDLGPGMSGLLGYGFLFPNFV